MTITIYIAHNTRDDAPYNMHIIVMLKFYTPIFKKKTKKIKITMLHTNFDR